MPRSLGSLRLVLLALPQDAARKALQDAFAGKKDPFKLAEERAKKRGGGGGGGGSGGGGELGHPGVLALDFGAN